MTSLLALDASKYVGHAFFEGPLVRPKCGTWVAHGALWDSDDYSRYFVAFEDWLTSILAVLDPEVLAFESPLILPRRAGRGSDQNNIRRLIGIVSIAELVAAKRGIRCMEVSNQTAKMRMVGTAWKTTKDDMIVAATRMGYAVADQHQADAVGVAVVCYDELGTPVPDVE